MSRHANITRHGLNHAAGGSDPIPGIGAGSGVLAMLATWSGVLPATSPSYGSVWRVPYVDGVGVTFNFTRAFLRCETTGAGDTIVTIEQSPAGAFTGTDVVTLTVTAGTNEDEDTAVAGSIVSGGLLRTVFPATPGTTGRYTVQLEGEAA